jgi:predicted PolB exonuclease-like 3'-5' exonuclease
MLDRPLLAFDIETIPDPDVGRRVFGLEGDDQAVVRQMWKKRLEETEGSTGYPQLPHHRVVTIAAAGLDPGTARFKLAVLGGQAMEERSHLEGFFQVIRAAPRAARLVSWNGSGFDLAVIRYRSILHGVAAPEFYRTDGDWKWNNYQGRYHDLHVDLMDILSGYGASHRVGLGTLSELVGLPGKSFLEGEVWEHILRDEERLVEEYCKLDVLLTLLLFLSWTVHRGDLSRKKLDEYVTTIREALVAESFAPWREIAEGLEGWPR